MLPAFWRNSLAGLCALLIGIGIARFGYTPLIPVLIQHHWLDAGDAAYLGATNLAGYVGGSLLAAWLARLIPAAPLTRLAMLLTVVSLAACMLPWGFLWFAPWRFLTGFTGGLLMVAAVPQMLSRAPVALRARSNGIVFTGVGLGVIASGTLVPALAGEGPAAIWGGMAAVALLLTILTWRQWAPQPGDAAALPDLAARPFTRPVALLLIAYMLDSAAFVPHTVFWADFIARGLHRGIEAGGFFWIFFGVGAMFGPVLAGLVAERLGFYRSLTGGIAVKATFVALPIFSQHPLALAASAMVVGALTPGISALASGRIAELVGFAAHRQVWGWLTGGFAIASAGAGYLMSFLFARYGSYYLLFAIGTCGLSIAMVLSIFVRNREA